MNRRRFLQLTGTVSGAWLVGGVRPRSAFGSTRLLDPLSQPRFVNPLPNPLDPRLIYAPTFGSDGYTIGVSAFSQSLGLYDPEDGAPLMTPVWGYGGPAQQDGLPAATDPGRTFVAYRDVPVTVQWTNDLFGAAHLLPVDTTVHWANPLGAPLGDPFGGPVPVVPHLHGGHTESDSDGLPEYWWTPGEAITGPRFVKTSYFYGNDQPAGTLWYHDHALGITRLNVYAGLAGFYILRDQMDTGMPGNPLGLPANDPSHPGGPVFYEVPIVIQDRLFTAAGQLFYPTEPDEVESGFPPPPAPSALPEFFGDIIVVNGQAWPVLDVEPRKYRFRLLNGSDSRSTTPGLRPTPAGSPARALRSSSSVLTMRSCRPRCRSISSPSAPASATTRSSTSPASRDGPSSRGTTPARPSRKAKPSIREATVSSWRSASALS